MNTIILENCIIYRHQKIEEILNILTLYDKEESTVIVKFSNDFGINLIINNINLERIESNIGKQSSIVITNVNATRYKLSKDIRDLSYKEVEQFSSKGIMLIKNINNGNYYILDKMFYNRKKTFNSIKEEIIKQMEIN